MADPILNRLELTEGDSTAYARQNEFNLLAARLGMVPYAIRNDETYPSATPARGDMYVIPSGATSHWAGQAANTLAIALSVSPSAPGGWFFLPMSGTTKGVRIWINAGTGTTGHVVWNGSAFVAV